MKIRAAVAKRPDATLRCLAFHLAAEEETVLSKSSLATYLNVMGCAFKKSTVKPTLTAAHLKRRLEFVLDKIVDGQFNEELTTIHVDEKWFYMTRTKRKLRLFPGDARPRDETTHHKSHIPKIMFLAAVGTPHFLPNGEWFDGRIGLCKAY